MFDSKLADVLFDILKSGIGAVLGISLSFLVWKYQEWRRYARWHVVVKDGDRVLVVRPVGSKKAKEVLDDISSLSVFLKGVASPFGWINLDLVSQESKDRGLLVMSKKSRAWIIDLSKNPPPPEKKPIQKG